MALMRIKELASFGKIGDWAFVDNLQEDDLTSPAFIVIRLPDGMTSNGDMATLLLNDIPNPKVEDWQWDGNTEAPTLTPSINWPGVWHGYLRGGKLIPA